MAAGSRDRTVASVMLIAEAYRTVLTVVLLVISVRLVDRAIESYNLYVNECFVGGKLCCL